MTIDITSFFFNSSIEGATATAAWGTSIGQNQTKSCRIESSKPGVTEILTGMLYKSIPDRSRLDISAGSSNRDVLLFSKFDKVFINGTLLEDQSFVLLLVRENTESHSGRLLIAYPPYATVDEVAINEMAIHEMASALGCNENGCWFVHDISVINQDELHFSAIVVNPTHAMVYKGRSRDRSRAWAEMVLDLNNGTNTHSSNKHLSPETTAQTIYYGCPGTGKSYEVKRIAEGENGIKIIWYDENNNEVILPSEEEKTTLSNNIFRTTFHPDYDYATFVGCYKPGKDVDGHLDYRFVPQVFTNAYVTALRHPEDPVYLIIEEINRGNCAQIFGDLFQLLDRTDGVSDFAIKPDTELSNYLSGEGVPSDSLRLPANLHIYATMNTSDQSLFPMDSAFKRRWAMEYMPINYEHPIASKYTVTIAGRTFRWLDFLKWANFQIRESTSSEDKQMGEFFIRCGNGKNIAEKEFVNKVMFYIWNDICKDYYNPRHVTKQFFMRLKTKQENELDYFTFAELFDKKRNEGSRLLLGFMEYIEAAYKEKHPDEAASADGTPSEPSASSPAVEAQ